MTANLISSIGKIGMTLGLAFSVSSIAASSGFAYSSRAQQMCMGDAMRLCSSEIPNISRIIACMRRNKANVSAGCRAVMEQEDPASRPKPVQAASTEQKPPATARAEPAAPPRPKPVVVALVEPKPPVAARAESPVPVAPTPAPAAPVEHKPAAAPVAPQPAAAETTQPQGDAFEQKTLAVSAEQPHRPRVNPFRHLAARKLSAVSILARAAVNDAKLAQFAATEQKPATVAPVVVPGKIIQATAAEQSPSAAAPAAVKATPVATPVKAVRRKQKPRQVAVAAYTPRDGGGYERYISMAAPIVSLIMSNW